MPRKKKKKTAKQYLERQLHPGVVALVLLLVAGLFVAVFASQRSTYYGSDASTRMDAGVQCEDLDLVDQCIERSDCRAEYIKCSEITSPYACKYAAKCAPNIRPEDVYRCVGRSDCSRYDSYPDGCERRGCRVETADWQCIGGTTFDRCVSKSGAEFTPTPLPNEGGSSGSSNNSGSSGSSKSKSSGKQFNGYVTAANTGGKRYTPPQITGSCTSGCSSFEWKDDRFDAKFVADKTVKLDFKSRQFAECNYKVFQRDCKDLSKIVNDSVKRGDSCAVSFTPTSQKCDWEYGVEVVMKNSNSNAPEATQLTFDARNNYAKQQVYLTAQVKQAEDLEVSRVEFYAREKTKDGYGAWKKVGEAGPNDINKDGAYAISPVTDKILNKDTNYEAGTYQFTANVYFHSGSPACTGNPSYSGKYFQKCSGSRTSKQILVPAFRPNWPTNTPPPAQ